MENKKEKKKTYSPTFNFNSNPQALSDEQQKIIELLFLTSIKLFGTQEAVSNILLLKPDLIHNFFKMLKLDLEKAQQKLLLLLGHEHLNIPNIINTLLEDTLDKSIANITKKSVDLKNLAQAYQVLNTFFTLYFQDKENIEALINNLSSHDNNNDNNMEEESDEVYCAFN